MISPGAGAQVGQPSPRTTLFNKVTFFLNKHLRKELALVFEFIPNCCRQPPPKERPDSTIAIPSPEFTNSCSLRVRVCGSTC